jgi:catechol 2,3-dioxygenase-like lactoylglutathione lyase family enzyme
MLAEKAQVRPLPDKLKPLQRSCENMTAPSGDWRFPIINGAHIVIYTKDAEADRAFFRDVLKLSSVDGGQGWLIFAMPPLEAAFHDSEKNDQHELFFMCEDIAGTLKDLKSKKVKVSGVSEQRWGKVAKFELPGGGKIGVYEPKHPSPLNLGH